MVSHYNVLCIIKLHVSVAAKVTENTSYKILGKEVTVELVEPKTPPSVAKTFIAGQSIVISDVPDSISEPLLYLYFDNVTELDGEGGDYVMKRQNQTQLLLTFNSKIDLPHGGECVMCKHIVYCLGVPQCEFFNIMIMTIALNIQHDNHNTLNELNCGS